MTATPITAWSPLRRPLFRALWISDVVSSVGTWMHDSAAAWLMTLLAPSPLMVSLVQAATTMPLFLLALPGGALADIMDRRRVLLVAQVWLFLMAALLGVLTVTGLVQPWMLLAITLAIGAGSAVDIPAWQAMIPEVVPREELPASVGLGTVAINVAGAVVGCLGLGGLLGAALSPGWRRRWSTDAITALATAVFAFGCLALAWVTNFGLLLGAMVIAGAGWLVVVSSLILAAQRGAAEWVRGRALAVSTLTLFGSLAVGALLGGVVANELGIKMALTAAGGGLLVGLGLIPRFRLAAAEALHLDRSQIWQDPVVAEALDPEAGPVLVTVEYTLEPAKRAAFATALRRLVRPIRRRDGAVFWELFVDSANPHRCVECYLGETWAQPLRPP